MTRPRDPWGVIEYEIQMYVWTRATLSAQPLWWAQELRNCVVESAVLHTRILCEVFCKHSREYDDDIRPEDLFPDWDTDPSGKYKGLKRHCDALKTLYYGDGKMEGSPCWVFNKMLAHPTALRGTSYDYSALLALIGELLNPVIRDLKP